MNSVVMMGVAGCGKSSAGSALAQALHLPLVEGDDFHSPSNVEKMRSGHALTDADRADWLAALSKTLAQHPEGVVLTCSALRRDYRERLRAHSPGLQFVFLDIDKETALRRVTARANQHFFTPASVDSQFATLESPVGEVGVLRADATQSLDHITTAATRWVRQRSHEKDTQ